MRAAILQARTSSRRLPGKVLKPLLGRPMLARQIERIRLARNLDRLMIATSTDPSDDAIANLGRELGVEVFRGSLEDVLDRFYQAAKIFHPETVIRLTGDCPLVDPDLLDQVIDYFEKGGYDYVSNALQPTFPDGLDVEVMRIQSLEKAWKNARLPSEREHVTPYLYAAGNGFSVGKFQNSSDLSHLRWTVDNAEDFALIEKIYGALYPTNPRFSMQDILKFLAENPDLTELNRNLRRNEGSMTSRQDDLKQRYKRSLELHERANRVIPLGSQTFSKSKTQYPVGAAPLFIAKGQGSQVEDVDGNRYVDFVNGLCAVTLGYNDPDVTRAVREQLEDGVIFSLPHILETEVSEQIVEMVSGAEMVRFGKNGSDATTGAVRVARAFTNRERVAVCGYHGWQDWYIGSTTLNRGVPQSTRDLTHVFEYNNADSLEKLFKAHSGEFAAVIFEPMNTTKPKPGFLEEIKALTHRHGALLIFDETITGFRFANGGAQELFKVTPDLSTFGKGMANGYPVSAVAGRRDIMMLMEKIFFSFTFGGELLSLAAAQATLRKLKREPVIETIWKQGRKLMDGVTEEIKKSGAEDFLSLAGSEPWSFLTIKDFGGYSSFEIKTLFLQEVFARGVLTIGTHNMSYAHTDADLQKVLNTYSEVFPLLKAAITETNLKERLAVPALEPLFKIR